MVGEWVEMSRDIEIFPSLSNATTTVPTRPKPKKRGAHTRIKNTIDTKKNTEAAITAFLLFLVARLISTPAAGGVRVFSDELTRPSAPVDVDAEPFALFDLDPCRRAARDLKVGSAMLGIGLFLGV